MDAKQITPPPNGDCGNDSDDEEDLEDPNTKELEALMERLDRLAVTVPPSIILVHLKQATSELELKAKPPSRSVSSAKPPSPPPLVRQNGFNPLSSRPPLSVQPPSQQAPAKLAPATAPTPMDTK